jgi:pilus assembly protein CpaD
MIRALSIAGLALLAAACASTQVDKDAAKDRQPLPLTPTEQFAITVTPHADQILLAQHPDGLSSTQERALSDLVGRWRDVGQGGIVVQTPAGGGSEAYRSATTVQQALVQLGVPPDQIRLASYDSAGHPEAPIAIGYDGYQAKGPECGRQWTSFTHSASNQVNGEFGCATTANMAAMIANPADLIRPRAEDSSNADRRIVVLGKYANGELTSTPKDSQADGAVSDVGQ